MFSFKADEKRLQLIFDRAPDVPQYICTDEVKLRQVLINLPNNALKFTETGGVSLRVSELGELNELGELKAHETQRTHKTLQTHKTRLTLHFEIEDTGPGIPPHEPDTIFEAFTQTETGRRSWEGTGLGLPISRKFAQMMGGQMTVSSQVGRAATFKFDIRAGVVEAADIESQRPAHHVIALEPDQPRYRILIVDNRWSNRQLLIKLLHPLGFDLREAGNGQEAIEVWESWHPHLTWMDIRMPVMDGYKATRQIKSKI